MMDRALLEAKLAQLPLYTYAYICPADLDFTDRVRWICEHECPMYGKSWACPPAVGSVEKCKARCGEYAHCLMIATITEVRDISDIEETLATRPDHEEITDQVRDFFQEQGITPYILSTEACAACPTCTVLEGKPCRKPGRMHPCLESHGINLLPLLEEMELAFQYGENVVTWFSLLFFNE